MKPKDTKRTIALSLLFLTNSTSINCQKAPNKQDSSDIYYQMILGCITVVDQLVWTSQIPGEQETRVDLAKALFIAVFDSSTCLINP